MIVNEVSHWVTLRSFNERRGYETCPVSGLISNPKENQLFSLLCTLDIRYNRNVYKERFHRVIQHIERSGSY